MVLKLQCEEDSIDAGVRREAGRKMKLVLEIPHHAITLIKQVSESTLLDSLQVLDHVYIWRFTHRLRCNTSESASGFIICTMFSVNIK